ncbi:hypothetical protein [Pseudomonas asiatica]|uniref:hypothetical protein n=1 Tax=Pseudomonas asiatica TaxID=2219225 RepID=UPI0010C03DC8|nr:hypothetical protein [Pseudomonas asiatica]
MGVENKVAICFFTVIVVVVVGVSYKMVNRPEPVSRSAGTVKSLQLHNTALSTVTTIETTEGWYQVQGAVSASKGDPVRILTEGNARGACVASDGSESCFNMAR